MGRPDLVVAGLCPTTLPSRAVHAGLRIQINELLAKPWQASIAQRQDDDIPTPIVIVDALEESDRWTEFFEELFKAGQRTGIRVLVTSRPEPKTDIEKESLPELKENPELVILPQRAGGFFICATTAVRFISPLHTSRSIAEMRFHLQVILNSKHSALGGTGDERLGR